MKRLIVMLIAILVLIIGAGRTKVTVTSDYMPVVAEITEELVSARKRSQKPLRFLCFRLTTKQS